MLDILSKHRRFIITGLLVLFSVGFLGFFEESENVSPVVQGFIVSLVFFLAIPVLYSKIILREPLENIGWRRGDALAGVVSGIASVGLGVVVSVLLIKMSPFKEQYHLPGLAESEFLWFVLYEVVLVSLVTFLYEVFFRGFIQLLWLRDFGFLAVIAQVGIFYLLFFLSGGFLWQNAPILIFALFSGIIAHVSRSIRYSFAASWLFFFITDILVLTLH
jgi:membrane protease YdiL (CAAX protease family)